VYLRANILLSIFLSLMPRFTTGLDIYRHRGADKSLTRPGRKSSYIPLVLWNLELHHHTHNSPPPVPTLAKAIHFSAQHTFDKRSLFPSWSG